MALQCEDSQFFAPSIYLLDKTNRWNLKICPSCLLEEISPNFWGAELETRSQFFTKLSMVLQCHKFKLLPQFLVEPMYLLDKKPHKIWNFEPSRPLQQNRQKFSRAELETKCQFFLKLSMALSVTRWNSYHSFWLNQCTF